jgi:hypothetical protein
MRTTNLNLFERLFVEERRRQDHPQRDFDGAPSF